MKYTCLRTLYLLCLLSLVMLMHTGCGGGPGQSQQPEIFTYRIEGTLIKDLNTDFAHAVATITRDDTTLATAELRLDGDSLAHHQDSIYYRYVLPAGDYAAGTHELVIRDSSWFLDTLLISLPGNFAIDSVLPTTRQKRTVDHVSLNWSGSAGTDRYVIAAVKMDSIYAGLGFTQYVTSLTTSETFPDSAFALPGGDPDTGWFYVYVYSYTGTPDSALSATLLPSPMPSQLDDNISGQNIAGRLGAIVVAAFDSIRVVTEP
ncbi:MAG: hypothetical protein ABII79_11320 [bacterium]